ncbi:MAG: glycosyltransferase [Proteobacteria bacterium]|nr:glycosyltransferase [Pseudomonadota bacterium]MBU1686336.1 glycosyltransferase [Pseudomonadota bacterium]
MVNHQKLQAFIHSRLTGFWRYLRAIPKAIRHYGSLKKAIPHTLAILRRDGFSGIKLRMAILQVNSKHDTYTTEPTKHDDLYLVDLPPETDFHPTISVIVPNYNHAPYLRQRLESIYNQSYRNFEVILLDDCSKDGSTEILREYADQHSDRTTTIFNEKNSGGTFNQWKAGLTHARGELVWIAESDDYCSTNFLSELVGFFANEAVMLAFCRSDFITGSPLEKIWSSEEYLAELKLHCWHHRFIKSTHWMVNHAWAIKNVIPNVSSTLFRHPGKMALLDDQEWLGLRLCGDWIFYLTIARGGLVGYSPEATNFYRQHPNNTSVNAQSENLYYHEHELVAQHLMKLFHLQEGILEWQQEVILKHWIRFRGEGDMAGFNALYDPTRIRNSGSKRKKNIVMALYALVAGGGETFPIMLANLLKEEGYAVTLYNCKQEKTEPGVRKMLDQKIPLLELADFEILGPVFEDLGIELVHSHHTWVDTTVSSLLINNPGIRQVVTMHGMYEMLTPEQLSNILPILDRRVDRFVYIADKNLLPFTANFREEKRFTRIDNTMPIPEIHPIPRSELGIPPEDFVLCIVSRAIPEKGWEEAIATICWANNHGSRTIHLLLVGNGPELDRLNRSNQPEFIHFLGFRANTLDYFAGSDLGFLPSRFSGESSPLVLIDCLHANRPMLASNIGEIAKMLQTETGCAGALFDLLDWEIPIAKVGAMICKLAEDPASYKILLDRVPEAAEKFDPRIMLGKYEEVYTIL